MMLYWVDMFDLVVRGLQCFLFVWLLSCLILLLGIGFVCFD